MTKIEIEKSEYESLLTSKTENKALQEKVTKLEEETKNKGIALEEAREKAKTDAKTLKTEIEVEKGKNAKILEKLWLTENDDPLTKIDELSNTSTEYWKILEKEKQERTQRIEDFKKKLWEDFLKDKTDLFEWLDEVKQEKFLKEFIVAKWLDKDPQWNPIQIWVHSDWQNNPGNASDFDKMLSGWTASVSDLIGAMK